MKLSPAQRSLLLAMYGGAKVFKRRGRWWLSDAYSEIMASAEAVKAIMFEGLAIEWLGGELRLTAAGRELAQRLSEGATDEAK